MTKNRSVLIFLGVFTGLLAQACSSSPRLSPRETIELTATIPALNLGETGEILFLTRQGFINPVLYSEFQDSLDAEVTEQYYSDDQKAIDLVRSYGDNRSYGLALLSNYAAQVLIEEGRLAELEPRNVPNLREVADRFQNLPYDPDNRYCAPVQWSTTGLVYDAAQIPPPEHWGSLFTSDPGSPVFGRLSLLDNSRESFAAALLHLGYDVNSQDDREIREAAEILRQSAAARFGFAGVNLGDLLMSREIALAQAENRNLSPSLETNENLAYSLPNEGGILHVDSLCVLATAPPDIKAAAERFIDFILEPKTNSNLASYNFAASTLRSARELLPVGTVGENFMYPQNLDLVPLHLIQPLGEIDKLYQELFEEIKASQ